MGKSYQPVNALLRGLDVMTHISSLGKASVRDLHALTNIAKPTIIRNLETLEHAGYVSRNSDSGLYSLTARVLSLCAGYDHHQRLIELAAPLLNEFRKKMPWPSDIALFDRDAMVIVESNRDPGALALNRPVGTRLSMTESALGRAYMAFCDSNTKDLILDRHFAENPDTGVTRDQLEQNLARYRNQGFSENNKSLSRHTLGIGVPILLHGRVEACINTIVLAEALNMDEVIQRCVEPLKTVAEQISSVLEADEGNATGYSP